MIETDSAARYFSNAYVLRETVPDFAAEVARWEQLGADLERDLPARGGAVEIHRTGEHPRQDLALFRARAGRDGVGLAVFIHGGFWRMMDRRQSHFVAAPFVARGWDCAVIEYRLMPAVRLQALVDDTVAALCRLRDLGRWPRRLLAGHSAGAHLALHGGLAAREQGASGPDDRLLLISGVFDIEAIADTSIAAELQMSAGEVSRWSCYGDYPRSDQATALLVGAQETGDFIRQSYIGASRLGLGERDCIARLPGAHHLSVVTRYASEAPVFEAVHRLLPLD